MKEILSKDFQQFYKNVHLFAGYFEDKVPCSGEKFYSNPKTSL
jgi:hypothetical protein